MEPKTTSSSNTQAFTSGLDVFTYFEAKFQENLSENQKLTASVIKELTESVTECKRLTRKVHSLEELLKNSLEKIESQAEEINRKDVQLKALKNDNAKLRNESDSMSQRLNHFQVIMNEISSPLVTVESLNNHDKGNHRLNERVNLEQASPINSTEALKHNPCQSSFNIQPSSFEANAIEQKTLDYELDAMDDETQPTTTHNNGYKRTNSVIFCDELVPQHGNGPETKRLKRVDSTPPETFHNSNADSEINSIIAPQNWKDFKEKKQNRRKNIRKVMNFQNLAIETQSAYRRERTRRIQSEIRLQIYNETYGQLPGEVVKSGLVLDFDPNTKKELLIVDTKLSMLLKPYQREGVKFMWDACFESIETLKSSNGGGCILAHCMGLGKTLQVIALVHTLLSNQLETNVKKVLIICPVNVIYNWKNEFEIWLRECSRNKDINVYELVTGLTIETTKMNKKEKKMVKIFQESSIDPGADLVVCDEGHLLKNPNSRLSKAVNRIRTLRRIVLTGTPLQNNLSEYYCMVEFVKPQLLGTENEFTNGFKNPIENGQYSDSKEWDIILMQLRSHILHKLLDGCVQRRDYSVLSEFLPPKQEYVLFIRLSDVQITLYKFHITNFQTSGPIGDFAKLRKICNHPKVLVDFDSRRKQKKENDAENDPESYVDSDAENSETLSTALPNDEIENHEWWIPLCNENKLNARESSGKMLALFTIINECEALGDKLLVFSCCLSTLNVIEEFLAEIQKQNDSEPTSSGFKGSWKRGIDYFRLDGTKSALSRSRDISNFNSTNNLRARLFLISTKAGGIGINLMAANRVVIFDASWNPSNDIQNIFRTYRIGQTKECYVYRFIALGTMEEKIYERQITKLSLAKRVIDEYQIGRQYKENQLKELYSVDNINPPNKRRPEFITNAERILNSLLKEHSDIIFKYHDHDSLLEVKIEERLTKEEKKEAWEDFQKTSGQ